MQAKCGRKLDNRQSTKTAVPKKLKQLGIGTESGHYIMHQQVHKNIYCIANGVAKFVNPNDLHQSKRHSVLSVE